VRTIPPEKIAEVRDRADIERIVSRSVQLKKQGHRLSGCCPFHDDKSPSFSVDAAKKLFYCFGCQVGGDVFDFVKRIEGVDFGEAVRMLARETGVELPEREETPSERRRRTERERMYRVNELARGHFEAQLAQDDRAIAYLREERGLSPETVRRFHLGFAPDGWTNLADALEKKSVANEVPLALGLVGRRKSGGVYDRLRGKVIFPIGLPSGDTAGFGARRADWLVTDEDDRGPKYLNSPESPVYEKSKIFYGLEHGRDAIRKAKLAILVEGYFDVIALHQAGIPLAIACCGTALSGPHATQLSKLADEVVTLYDGDAAGQKATRRAAETLLAAGVSVRVLRLPSQDDPDTYVRREGVDALNTLVERAPSAVDAFLEDAIRANAGAGVAGLVRIASEIRPLLLAVRDQSVRDLMVEGAAQRLRIDASVLRAHLRGRGDSRRGDNRRGDNRRGPAMPAQRAEHHQRPRMDDRAPSPLECMVLRLLVERPAEVLERLETSGADRAFEHPVCTAVVRSAFEARAANGPFDGARALEIARESDAAGPATLDALQKTLMQELPVEEDLGACIKRLLQRQIRMKLRDIRERIAAEQDPETSARLNAELAEAVRARASLL